MNKTFYTLGLMSGTSGDGVDASLVVSDGKDKFDVIDEKYEEYSPDIYKEFHELKERVLYPKDFTKNKKKIRDLERKITIFNTKLIEKIKNKIEKKGEQIHLIGFHGQTLLHSPEQKISIQLGDGKLLSQITKTRVVFDFRSNDLKNGGQGAPLAPIFHQLLVKKKKIETPITILNLGGIANVTIINKDHKISSLDIGPGNCLIDSWIRLNSNQYYDKEGKTARSGKVNKIILDQAIENFNYSKIPEKKSYDTNDFDLSFVKGLSLKDGASTLTEFTARICSKKLKNQNIYACGGGRKNKFLMESIGKKTGTKIKLIDELDVDGDFIESQAFAYLAVRSYLNLPISFPETTGCKIPSMGGVLVKNF